MTKPIRKIDATALDAAILTAIREGGPRPTYVIRNHLCMRDHKGALLWPHGRLETRHVLTGCKRLERAGKLRRVPTSYLTMISWGLADLAAASGSDQP